MRPNSAPSALLFFGKIMSRAMTFPIKTCILCGEEFELRPEKPGFANRCHECSEPDAASEPGKPSVEAGGIKDSDPGLNAERRRVMRDMLYRKES
jgi:hypothetical protein